MAKSLKGITIKIGADTKQLNDALKNVDKQVYGLNGDLKNLNNALKLDPKNTELLAQKQDVLKRNIEQTTQRLNMLKEAQKQMGDYNKLTDEGKAKYNALSGEIAKAENALRDMNSQLKQTNQIDLSKITSALKKVGDVALQVVKKVAQIGTAVAGAIAGIVAAGVKEYAEYEQQLGGIEALFGKNEKALKQVQKTGETAWKDLTLSTSDYYREFTKTYTLVKNSIPNTDKAIKTTNRMIQLESDLSNTFGYDITTASNAINWALKGSFNYIDNLNLGIKGTKKGFLEAANECGYLVKSVDELTSDQILDVLEQYANKFGVMGRTEKEAADTIQGSLKSLKAAWSNFISGVGKPEELSTALKNFLNNVVKTIKKLAPAIINGLLELIQDLLPKFIKGLKDTLPKLINTAITILDDICTTISENVEPLVEMVMTLITNICDFLVQNLPQIIEAALQIVLALANGIVQYLPQLIPAIIETILKICTTLLDNLDLVIDAAINIILAIIEGLINAIPKLIEYAPQIIIKLVEAVIKAFPKLLTLGFKIIKTIIKGLTNALPDKAKEAVQDIIDKIKEKITELWEDIKSIGSFLIDGIVEGVKSAGKAVKGVGDWIVGKVKGFLGIHSPSRVARDEIGYYFGEGLVDGILKGIEDTEIQVKDAMTQLGNGINASVNPTINPTANTNPLILQIENFYNNRDTDIQKLAEELEFYRKKSATAKGGN